MHKMIGKYVIVRSRDSGVHAGTLADHDGDHVTLREARRIWYWDGAATLSQLSQEGVKRPENCKFPCEVPEIIVIGVCEIIPCTELAKHSIQGVEVWKE